MRKIAIKLTIVGIFFSIILPIILRRSQQNHTNVVVNTPDCGNIMANIVQLNSYQQVYEFHNVPYAVPPLGPLRFKPPQLFEGGSCYSETLDASDISKHIKCIQFDSGEGTEDCLILNIRSTDLSAAKPVIVWVHGGGLSKGSASDPGYHFDSKITADVDVVAVNVNYRLGYLGFGAFREVLDPQDGNYGNNGFRDIIAALTWIQNNIRAFGGNPHSVSIVGHSAGGVAVLALLSAHLANGLFHNAVSFSAAPEFRFDHVQLDKFQRPILSKVGCLYKTAEDRKKCLMGIPAVNLTSKQTGFLGLGRPLSKYFSFPYRYGEESEYTGLVSIDPVVMPLAPKYLKHADFTPKSKIKVVISTAAQEPALVSEVFRSNNIADSHDAVFTSYTSLNATLTSLFKNLTNDTEILNKVYTVYSNMSTPQLVWDTLVSDMRYTCPTNTLAVTMTESAHHDVYRLHITNSMEHEPTFSSFHRWESFALFGFLPSSFARYAPGQRDLRFRDHLKDVIRKLITDKDLFMEWKTFPKSTLVLDNSNIGFKISTESPQYEQCKKLLQLDLVKYGRQM